MSQNKIEITVHVLCWLLILATINIDWTSNWLDPSLRPNTPASLSLILFAVYFYTNAFVLIPRYFSFKTWQQYLIYAFLLFMLPEIIRIIFYQSVVRTTNFQTELFSRDSFVFGSPSAFFFALNASFLYRLTMDWFRHKNRISELQKSPKQAKATLSYEGKNLLTEAEVIHLKAAIVEQLEQKELYMNPTLSLRNLAEAVNSSEKKISYLLNQHLNTTFFELLNKHQVEKFKVEIFKPENQNLSIIGVALNCGFSSKSSFYRAFKAAVGLSPSAYIKSVKIKRKSNK